MPFPKATSGILAVLAAAGALTASASGSSSGPGALRATYSVQDVAGTLRFAVTTAGGGAGEIVLRPPRQAGRLSLTALSRDRRAPAAFATAATVVAHGTLRGGGRTAATLVAPDATRCEDTVAITDAALVGSVRNRRLELELVAGRKDPLATACAAPAAASAVLARGEISLRRVLARNVVVHLRAVAPPAGAPWSVKADGEVAVRLRRTSVRRERVDPVPTVTRDP